MTNEFVSFLTKQTSTWLILRLGFSATKQSFRISPKTQLPLLTFKNKPIFVRFEPSDSFTNRQEKCEEKFSLTVSSPFSSSLPFVPKPTGMNFTQWSKKRAYQNQLYYISSCKFFFLPLEYLNAVNRVFFSTLDI